MNVKLKQAQDKVRELAAQALAVVNDEKLTPAEQKAALDKIEPDIKHWTDEVSSLQHVEEQRKRFLAAVGQDVDPAGETPADGPAASMGAQFVESEGYKGLIGRQLKGSSWSSGPVELKATLSEGTAAAPGPGWGAVQTPTVLPGVVDIRFRQLTVADLFPQGVAVTPLIRYLVESAVTNAAAPVAEGALKPESALTLTVTDETLKKIATFLPVTDEMLEDYQQIRSYIDGRLQLFVALAEETQLLSGDGVGANLVGILNRSGLRTSIAKGTAPSLAADNDMDAIMRQITAIRINAFLEPDAILMDPASWQNIVLSKNSQGAYYAGGPFLNTDAQVLWGKRVVVTPAMPASTALVGAFRQGGQVWRKGGITVEASNSHADFFQRNQTAIRAEERLGLAVYRPGAFGTVTNL